MRGRSCGCAAFHLRTSSKTFSIADHVVFIANGGIAAQGSPEALRRSDDPLVRQFVSAAPDGPVRFHYAAAPIAEDFGLGAGR